MSSDTINNYCITRHHGLRLRLSGGVRWLSSVLLRAEQQTGVHENLWRMRQYVRFFIMYVFRTFYI